MTIKQFSDREFIERIYEDVKDPELRQQVLKLLSGKNVSEDRKKNILQSIGVKTDAIPNNLNLLRNLNKVLYLLFFIFGVAGFVLSRDPIIVIISILWIIFMPVIFFINNKFYNNIVGKKPPLGRL